ncbi:MAG: HD domain-containing phosphohydrolase [Gemmatimonadales bacterium]
MSDALAGTVLLVDDDDAVLEGHAGILGRFPGLLVLTAPNAAAALETARIHRPDLILSDLAMPGGSGLELCARIRAEPDLDGTLFVIVTGVQDPHAETGAANAIDDILIKPVVAAELIGKVRSMLRLKRVHDELRADKLELERLHLAVEKRSEQMLSLLVHLVDLSVPGSAARAAETARLAAAMAERFEIPPVLHRDLDTAARLQEIGRLLLRADRIDGEGPEDVIEGDNWRYAVAAQELLQRTEGLENAAELIGAIFENWDGTGHPGRLRQGQIPLRSRILRILIDYQGLLAAANDSADEAMAQLLHHGGTRYDPLALAYFEALIRDTPDASWRESRLRVPVSELEIGMVLAEDLCTSSGVKLMAKGATLNGATLELVMRRHRSDPIPHGAWVERPPA